MVRDPSVPVINEDQAEAFVRSITDETVRNLVEFGVTEARLNFARTVDESVAEWRGRLPQSPLDLHFYARLLASMFERKHVMTALMEGKSIAEASGWGP